MNLHWCWSHTLFVVFCVLYGCIFGLAPACAAPLKSRPDYWISAVVPFEDVPSVMHRRGEPTSARVVIEASPGEFEPGSFVLTTSRGIKNVILTPTDLKNGDNTISKENVDVRVVKVWEQAGLGPRKTKPVTVGELLVKDDAAPFVDFYTEKRHYIPPEVPSGPSVRTDIQAMEGKQFWLTVKVPQEAPPGKYRGDIRIESNESGIRETLEVELTVLPIGLREPGQDRIIYYRGALDPARSGDFVGEERFMKELQDIREHGFTGLTLYDHQEQHVRRGIEFIAKVGFPGPIVFMEPNPKFLKIAKAYSVPALFYGVDEPNNPERIKAHLAKSSKIRALNGKVVVAISRTWAFRLADPKDLNDPLDVVTFSLNPDFFRWIDEGGPAKDQQRFPKSWFYWQIMMEKPGLHRLLSGFFLWRSRLDGIFPYVYQHLSPPSSPFDDFAKWAGGNYRVHMVTYPSANGPIPTLQWEALREGIDDLRYLTTLEALIAEAKTSTSAGVSDVVARASQALDELVRQVIVTDTRLGTDDVKDPIRGIGPREYAMWRKQIVASILALQQTLPSQQ